MSLMESLILELPFDTRYDEDPLNRLMPPVFVSWASFAGGTNYGETRGSFHRINVMTTLYVLFRTEGSMFQRRQGSTVIHSIGEARGTEAEHAEKSV